MREEVMEAICKLLQGEPWPDFLPAVHCTGMYIDGSIFVELIGGQFFAIYVE